MAIIKILPRSADPGVFLNYAAKKAAEGEIIIDDEMTQEVGSILHYAADPNKTMEYALITGVNCNTTTARDEFISVKKSFGNTSGRQVYHIFQSFQPGEGTPELVHEIGVKWAREVFGDRFQCTVNTHTDEPHLHSHIVVNSVSFVDGKKYHSNASELRRMQEISNRLCMEYGLSIIEFGSNKTRKSKEKYPITIRSKIRADIDRLILQSGSLPELYSFLAQEGYFIDTTKKHLVLKPPYAKRNIRLRSLGDYYSEQALTLRLFSIRRSKRKWRYTATITGTDRGRIKARPKLLTPMFVKLYRYYLWKIKSQSKKYSARHSYAQFDLKALERLRLYNRAIRLITKYRIRDKSSFSKTEYLLFLELRDEKTSEDKRLEIRLELETLEEIKTKDQTIKEKNYGRRSSNYYGKREHDAIRYPR